MSGRGNIGKAVEELTDHLRLVDHVRALQEGQKEIAEAIKAVNQRLTAIETEFRVLKAETQRDALREVQHAVQGVQSSMHDELTRMATRLVVLEQALRRALPRRRVRTDRVDAPHRADQARLRLASFRLREALVTTLMQIAFFTIVEERLCLISRAIRPIVHGRFSLWHERRMM